MRLFLCAKIISVIDCKTIYSKLFRQFSNLSRKNQIYKYTVCFAFFPRAQKMVNISNHLGEQFFGGAPDHVVAAGRARAPVRGSGTKPNFQGVPSQTFVI